VTSIHLAAARPGTKVVISVRPSRTAFHPPQSLGTAIVMVAAGAGIARFAASSRIGPCARRRKAGRGPALLFFGCDDLDVDLL
jgi:cytochrome P450/NADPH-cytochrome P450 reductase